MASPSLTKRHFRAIADMIRENSTHREAFTLHQVELIADFCASCNPRFDRERFMRYIAGECGPNGGAVKHAPTQEAPEDPIGVLVHGDEVRCFACEPLDPDKVPVYRVNIYPYKQSCAKCGKVLVVGRTPAWPQLFDGGVK